MSFRALPLPLLPPLVLPAVPFTGVLALGVEGGVGLLLLLLLLALVPVLFVVAPEVLVGVVLVGIILAVGVALLLLGEAAAATGVVGDLVATEAGE